MPEWTEEQKKAIDSRDGTILVSAAAGSGKTAVLVERVIRRLMDKEKPCSAEKLLIVTFTRAATSQMKERIFSAISDKLRENPDDDNLKHQLVMLPFANISTIDSFCGDIVRENFHSVDLTPDYRLLEGAELKLVEADAVSRTLDELYKENSPEFAELNNILTDTTNDAALSELIQKLYKNAMAFARPDVWLDSLVEEYNSNLSLRESRWGEILINQASETVKQCRAIAEKMEACTEENEIVKEKYGATVDDITAYISKAEEILETGEWDDLCELFSEVKFKSLGRISKDDASPQSEFVKAQKTNVSDKLKKLSNIFCISEEENREDMIYLKPVAEKLVSAVKRYAEVLKEEKQKINSVDFSDISHLALDLLLTYDGDGNPVKTQLAKNISEKFDEILVDEFQDINELQSSLFRAVSKDDTNMFTVGDVKQSIYRFRQAMPEIFLRRRDKMENYVEGNYPAKIILDRNFRSRKGVTENVNFVFRQIMSKDAGGLDYNRDEELVAAADYEPCVYPQTELHIIGGLDERVNRSFEAQHVADIIKGIIDEKMQVKCRDGMRDVRFGDICILMRSFSGGKAELFAEVLANNNIPAYVSNRSGFFAASEISLMLNLMRIIDNPVQDIPLLAVMFSPFCGFTADELTKMRIDERNKPLYHCVVKAAENGHKKSASFLSSLENIRMLSSTLSCSDFLRELYDVTGCKAIANAMPNGSQRNANLNMLLDYAAKYESSGKRGLSGFIRFIDRVQRQNEDLEAASDISEAADVVRIMTIHKSKGLEFPVCILADLSTLRNNDNKRSITAFHPDYGICFNRRDARTKCMFRTLGKKALEIAENQASVSEELRVLYVAMTRAMERLICVTRYDNIEKKLKEFALAVNDTKPFSPFWIQNRNCMADWITAAFMRHPDATVLRNIAEAELPILPAAESLRVEIINSVEQTEKAEEEATDEVQPDKEMLAEIEERMAYEYPFASLSSVKAKSAPSDFEKTDFDTNFFKLKKPAFLSKSGMNAASKGTATHKFMEFFDYSAENQSVDWQIEKMLTENRLTPEEAQVLERDKLSRFFAGEIAARIKKSPLLMREKKLTVGIKAGELYPELPDNVKDEMVVIQGYVDCAFEENGALIIVDYKTDRGVTMEELSRRYRSQLKMYERAMAECTGKKVKGTLIYSFENDDFIEI